MVFFAITSYSQNSQPVPANVTLKYLPREAISDTYLDENGNRNTVWNTREDAINYIKVKCEEAKKASVTSAPDNKLIPTTVYLWKSRSEEPNGTRSEVVKYDVKNMQEMK